jgi:hypothetical protein
MQLVAYGAQDVYLTGKPQITFWKLMYRRHTNFATESIAQTFNGTPGFGRRAAATISRNGDLISHVFLQIKAPKLAQPVRSDAQIAATTLLPMWDYETKTQTYFTSNDDGTHSLGKVGAYARYCNSFAHALVDYCEIEIGGQRIDKHYSAYYEAMDELTGSEDKRSGYGKMVGKAIGQDGRPADAYNPRDKTTAATINTHAGKDDEVTFYMPLRFWFNSNPGLALPLIALQYHEVKIGIQFRNLADLVTWDIGFGPNNNATTDAAPATADLPAITQGMIAPYAPYTPAASADTNEGSLSVELYVDYVYLDTDERRRFAQNQHEYLIEQLQFTGSETQTLSGGLTASVSGRYRLNFNHPCKELIFFAQDQLDVSEKNMHFNFGENTGVKGVEYVKSVELKLNGHDRFSARDGSYFRLVQPYMCHTRVPSRHVYCYSFGLRPEEHQPSGSCNFSRIDNATLHLTYGAMQNETTLRLTVYAVNYNILRIMSGMGGLAYSN